MFESPSTYNNLIYIYISNNKNVQMSRGHNFNSIDFNRPLQYKQLTYISHTHND